MAIKEWVTNIDPLSVARVKDDARRIGALAWLRVLIGKMRTYIDYSKMIMYCASLRGWRRKKGGLGENIAVDMWSLPESLVILLAQHRVNVGISWNVLSYSQRRRFSEDLQPIAAIADTLAEIGQMEISRHLMLTYFPEPKKKKVKEPCQDCGGNGNAPYSPLYPVKCRYCKGTGLVLVKETAS